MMDIEKVNTVEQVVTNGVVFATYWDKLVELFGVPLGQYCVKAINNIYTQLTILNMVLFILKCIPTAIYMHKFIKNMYLESRERIKQKQIELEDIQLQIEIVNNKLCCRDAEYAEREEKLKLCTEKLHAVRGQVRRIIADDEGLQQALKTLPIDILNIQTNNNSEEESKLIEELIKGIKSNKEAKESESNKKTSGEGCEGLGANGNGTGASIADDNDLHIKIIQVTNVYEMAFLEHVIKQKKQQRAQKEEQLKKQMNKTKKILNDWHTALSTVVGNAFTYRRDVALEEAMGDCQTGCEREALDDIDIRDGSDNWFEDDVDISDEHRASVKHYSYDEASSKCDGMAMEHMCNEHPGCNQRAARGL